MPGSNESSLGSRFTSCHHAAGALITKSLAP